MVNLPFWQRLLILGILFFGIVFALPNVFYHKVEESNNAKVRIELNKALETDTKTAEDWPSWLPSKIVNLGLDLRGGVHLLASVALDQVHQERYDEFWVGARNALAEEKERFGGVTREVLTDGFLIKLEKNDQLEGALQKVQTMASDLGILDFNVAAENGTIKVVLSPNGRLLLDRSTMAQSLEIVRRRIDATGTKEPTIQQVGDDRISIDVPGATSVDEVMSILGKTAKLSLHQAFEQTADANLQISADEELLPSREGGFMRIAKTPAITGDMIVDAFQGFAQQSNEVIVSFRLNPEGAKKFGDFTSEHVGEPFAIVLDGEILSAPVIRQYIGGGQAQISGNFTVEEAVELGALLKSGALPAELVVLEQSVVGPGKGQDSIDAGRVAAIVALIAVMAYMLWVYRVFGIFANISLIANMILIVALLSLAGSTLTLPGIAGIVLTIGMAVDANVLIFERIKEEFSERPVLIRAVDEGFSRALSSILDANITTLIAAVALYFFGVGPVRGFAVTLIIGIVTSVFTAVYLTRLLIVWYFEYFRPKKLGF